MTKENIYQEMNEKEIEKGLILFAQYLKKAHIETEHADPLKENCYTSSSDITGVFFPNTTFKGEQIGRLYEITAISKRGGKLGIVKTLRDGVESKNLAFDLFYTFESLLYSGEELIIMRKIDESINYHKNEIATCERLKTVSRKNGEQFKNLLQNFEGVSVTFDHSVFTAAVTSIKIGGYYGVTLYRKDEDKKTNATPTVEEITELRDEYIKTRKKWVEELEQQKKDLSKTWAKLLKHAEKIKKELSGVKHVKMEYLEELKRVIY